jgi:hypothetical protein
VRRFHRLAHRAQERSQARILISRRGDELRLAREQAGETTRCQSARDLHPPYCVVACTPRLLPSLSQRANRPGRRLIRLPANLFHRGGGKRRSEVALQIADEGPDLVLGLGSIGKDARASGIAFVEQLARHSAEAANAFWWQQPISVSSRSAKLELGRRLQANVAISSNSCSVTRPMVAPSTCICNLGSVSNRASPPLTVRWPVFHSVNALNSLTLPTSTFPLRCEWAAS